MIKIANHKSLPQVFNSFPLPKTLLHYVDYFINDNKAILSFISFEKKMGKNCMRGGFGFRERMRRI